jgi:hypothetical protein
MNIIGPFVERLGNSLTRLELGFTDELDVIPGKCYTENLTCG